ncbi:MAG TPA: RNA methyltransferase [Alcanivoracaceae bacterium]|nr:RNA methyltransferase [Alcanivoracaceae bacterium]
MLSKNQAKNIRALQRKKTRRETGLFLVEGEKIVAELLASTWNIHSLYATTTFLAAHQALVLARNIPVVECSAKALTAAGSLVTNNAAIAVAHQAATTHQTPSANAWTLALDDINDPGNLGSLLRIADWYGIEQLVCSPTTVDLYNPKVINASKGSFLRVPVQQLPLSEYFQHLPSGSNIYGAYLDGQSIHQLAPSNSGGVILLGSEAHGINAALSDYVTHKITIPAFGAAESLNVAVAAAIICDNIKRLHP